MMSLEYNIFIFTKAETERRGRRLVIGVIEKRLILRPPSSCQFGALLKLKHTREIISLSKDKSVTVYRSKMFLNGGT